MADRDEFSRASRIVLAFRAGDRCSNPECHCRTHWAHSDSSRAINLGVAAHITAAAPGGPRFDSRLSSAQRAATENGVWLCRICAELVDRDPLRYSAQALGQWKRTVERTPFLGVDRPTPDSQLSLRDKVYTILGEAVDRRRLAQLASVPIREPSGSEPFRLTSDQATADERVRMLIRMSRGDFTYSEPPTMTVADFANAVGREHFPEIYDKNDWKLGAENCETYPPAMELRALEIVSGGVAHLIRNRRGHVLASGSVPFASTSDVCRIAGHESGLNWLVQKSERLLRLDRSRWFAWCTRLPGWNWSANNVAFALAEATDHIDIASRLMEAIRRHAKTRLKPNYQDTFAWICYRQGDAEQAAALLFDVIQRSATLDATLLYHVYFVARRVGDHALAAAARLALWGSADYAPVELWRVLSDDDRAIPEGFLSDFERPNPRLQPTAAGSA